MLADAHLHLFPSGYPGAEGIPILGERREIDVYNELRALHNIVAGLVVGYEAGGIDEGNNEYLRGLAATNTWLSSVAYVEAAPAPSPARIEYLLARGHVGVAIYLPDAAAGRAVAGWPGAVWNALARRKAVVSLNARPEATAALTATIAGVPDVSFVFSHLGLPGPAPASPAPHSLTSRLEPLLELASLPNAHVKLSGLYAIGAASDPMRSKAYACVHQLLESFGPARCLWGSDFSPALAFETFADTLQIEPLNDLSVTERDAVMGGNLLAMLRAAQG